MVKLIFKSRHRIANGTIHRLTWGARSGHQSLKRHPRISGSSKKSSNGQATFQTETFSWASTAATARGNPSGRAMTVTTVKATSSIAAKLAFALATLATRGANGIPADSAATQNPTLIWPGMDEATVSK